MTETLAFSETGLQKRVWEKHYKPTRLTNTDLLPSMRQVISEAEADAAVAGASDDDRMAEVRKRMLAAARGG